MESAVDHGLLLEIAWLAEEHSSVEGFRSGVSDQLAGLVRRTSAFELYDPSHKALASVGSYGFTADHTSISRLPCDPADSGLLSQVVFGGRGFRGGVNINGLDFWPYAQLAHLWPADGAPVLMVRWRAGKERLGAVLAHGARRREAGIRS